MREVPLQRRKCIIPATSNQVRKWAEGINVPINGADSGLMVEGAGFRVQGSGFRVQGSDFRFTVQGSGFGGYGSELRVRG